MAHRLSHLLRLVRRPPALSFSVMPVYDYACQACGTVFEQILTLREHEERKPLCPKCRSKSVEQQPSTFFAQTTRKS